MKKLHIYVLILTGMFATAVAVPVDKENANANAIDKAEAGDISGAAEEAGKNNTALKGSLTWYRQSAIELVSQAYVFKGKQDDANARRAATAAIKILLEGYDKKAAASHAANRSQTYVQLGQAYEDLLGDRARARQCFEKALQDNPDNEQAKQMLAYYAAEEANFQRFVKGGK
ncbi:MAG: hypothetical protein WC378_08750 [Opitutaceae bacterium]|jgi:tetratricopeptide (TPR) repeat protein